MREEWKLVALNQLCEFFDRRGITPKKLGGDFHDTGYRVISAKNIKQRSVDLNFGEQRYVDKPTYEKWMNTSLLPDDVLLTSEAPLGEPAYITEELQWCLGQRLFGIRTNKEMLLGKFLFYGFQAPQIRVDLLSRATGATAQGIRKAELIKVSTPLPPLPEQERIVSILDKAFEGIDKAIAQTKQNLASARELFESYLNNIFTQKGEDWVEKKLGDVCKFSSGGTPSKKTTAYWSGKIPWVSGKDMKRDRIKDAILHISESAIADNKARIAKIGSLLILVRGMGLANGVAIAELTAPCSFNQDIKAIDPDPEVYSRFLLFSLKSSFSDSAKILSSAAHGTLKIEMDRLKVTPVSLPDYPQQKAIVTQLDALSDSIKQLEALYTQKLNDLKELKQSLLQQAFAGELTKEDAA
ncbi:MAG: restriction endonuclease subunit S [Akkermansiaceae bacterium]